MSRLPKSYELSLVERAKDRDEEAIAILMNQFKAYMKTQSYRRPLPSSEREDIHQYVTEDFFYAVDTFDPSKDTRFITHFHNCVYYNHGKRVGSLETQKRGVIFKECMSVDAKIPKPTDDESLESTIQDFVVDNEAESIFSSIELIASMKNLNKSDKEIIKKINEGYKGEEIAEHMGYTKLQYTKIKTSILGKIKTQLKDTI